MAGDVWAAKGQCPFAAPCDGIGEKIGGPADQLPDMAAGSFAALHYRREKVRVTAPVLDPTPPDTNPHTSRFILCSLLSPRYGAPSRRQGTLEGNPP